MPALSATPPAPGTTLPSPVRIYILWHPGFDDPEDLRGIEESALTPTQRQQKDRGLQLARRIYYWFRLENMEGIPVYFRSAPEDPGKGETPPAIHTEPGVLSYVIPLVDANMVSSPAWRAYVAKYAAKDAAGPGRNKSSCRVLPVAMESVAYNMPESMRRLNFIRHVPSAHAAPDDGELMAKLTEVLCRDLRSRLGETSGKKKNSFVPNKIKIFLSHAKADDTREAIALKEFIQNNTQCEAFFDETDIASSYDYEKVLQAAISQESAGLIVIQGDHYADRPWCRKEIRDFLKPVPEVLGATNQNRLFFIAPVVVVQIMEGKQIARTIPELGHAPCVRWGQPNAARFVVTTLLREILFGLFYRKLARQVADARSNTGEIFINRSPDPVMVNRILAAAKSEAVPPPNKIVHPGYGLSRMEAEGLKASFPHLTFQSVLDSGYKGAARSSRASEKGTTQQEDTPPDLAGEVVAISVGNSADVLRHGIGDEHINELLMRLLRKILRRQASILYAGSKPSALRPSTPWKERVNFTATLLNLLLTERDTGVVATPGKDGIPTPRLFNPIFWPDIKKITSQDIAQWTDICSFIKVPPEDAGVFPDQPASSAEGFREQASAANEKELADKSRCLSHVRRLICKELHCVLPDDPITGNRKKRTLRTFAHIFLGGKILASSGIMPGIFEEVLHAFEARKPVFLLAEGGGAAGKLAGWLSSVPASRPRELTPEFYEKQSKDFAIKRKALNTLAAAAKKKPSNPTLPLPPLPDILTPDIAMERLWINIQKAKTPDGLKHLLNNGLDGQQNQDLLTCRNSRDICNHVWQGLNALLKAKTKTKPAANSNAASKAKSKTEPAKKAKAKNKK